MTTAKKEDGDGAQEPKYVTVDEVNAILAKNSRATVEALSTKMDSKIDASFDAINKTIASMSENKKPEHKNEDEIEGMIENLDPKERKVLERLADSIADKKISQFGKKLEDKFVEFEDRVVGKAIGTISENTKKTETQDHLVSQFPQVLDENSDLRKRASQYMAEAPKDKKNNIVYQEWAIRKAAADLGIQPVVMSHPSVVNSRYPIGGEGEASSGGKTSNFSDEQLTEIARERGFDPKEFIKNVRRTEKARK